MISTSACGIVKCIEFSYRIKYVNDVPLEAAFTTFCIAGISALMLLL